MSGSHHKAYAFNRTRQAFLASDLAIANTHWTRLRGLMATAPESFQSGKGLWITPCHGVHTLAMRYPIDVVYLDDDNKVVCVEENVKPWRVTPVRLDAATVLEVPSYTVFNTGTAVGDEIEIVPVNGRGAKAS